MAINFEPGQKVHFDSGYHKKNGVIKSKSETNENVYFVVYHFGVDWSNYMDYTAEGTPVHYLRDGWVEKEE
jgi:hypothetical protein